MTVNGVSLQADSEVLQLSANDAGPRPTAEVRRLRWSEPRPLQYADYIPT